MTYGQFGQYLPYWNKPYYGPTGYNQLSQVPQVQPDSFDIPIQGFKFLTAKEIDGRIVLPGMTEVLVDRENKIIHIKSADQIGQSSDRKYHYEELIDKKENEASEPTLEAKINTDDFAKKEDLQGFTKSADFDELSKTLTSKIEALEKKLKVKDIMGDK